MENLRPAIKIGKKFYSHSDKNTLEPVKKEVKIKKIFKIFFKNNLIKYSSKVLIICPSALIF